MTPSEKHLGAAYRTFHSGLNVSTKDWGLVRGMDEILLPGNLWCFARAIFNFFPKSERALFKSWKDLVLNGISPAPHESFFIGIFPFGGRALRDDAEFSLKLYRKWGFHGRELLINKASSRPGIEQLTAPNVGVRVRFLKKILRLIPSLNQSKIPGADFTSSNGRTRDDRK